LPPRREFERLYRVDAGTELGGCRLGCEEQRRGNEDQETRIKVKELLIWMVNNLCALA
jgi:hypothetical protein